MQLDDMKSAIVILAVSVLIAASVALVLGDFAADDSVLGTETATCNATDDTYTGCGFAWNITNEGQEGVNNVSQYFDTIGTIIGIAVLITLIVGAFAFVSSRR